MSIALAEDGDDWGSSILTRTFLRLLLHRKGIILEIRRHSGRKTKREFCSCKVNQESLL